jgi:oligopeptidase A
MSNPLLTMSGLPPFEHIKPEHVEPAIDSLLAENRRYLEVLLNENSHYSWDTLIQPLEDMDDRLGRVWSPISHMNSVVNSEAWRNAYNACLPKLSEYSTELGQNRTLFRAFQSIRDSAEYDTLDTAQKKIIDNALRDFHLSGVSLPEDKKLRFREVRQRLSQLTTKFEENILDATQGWQRQVMDETSLAGLTDSARAMARQAAAQKKLEGWLFTLDFPSYYGNA